MPETLKSLIEQAEKKLRAVGIPSSRLEAEILLAHLLQCDRGRIISNPEERVPEGVVQKYNGLIRKRRRRYPLQYLIHKQEFYSLDFYVDERVFIPRPESELIVDEVLNLNRSLSPYLLDVGTGCGNLAISLAIHIPGAHAVATDLSRKALDVARINAKKHLVESRITFLQSSFLECFQILLGRCFFDFILSNPPYIKTWEMNSLQEEVRKFEPPSSLKAGEDGLDSYKAIIPSSFPLLRSGGYLIMEMALHMASSVLALISKYPFEQIDIRKDIQGIERIIVARKGSP